jgi:GNAT superfamily N-acetyltransferase
MLIVAPAQSEEDFDAVRRLCRAFVEWHLRTHPARRSQIEGYFRTPEFEAELADLGGTYAPPRNALLLARIEGTPAGCVGLHAYGDDTCEMKRMFVPEGFRGLGVGRALGDAIVTSARAAGYRRMLLETSRDQLDAIRLYKKLGFIEIAAYYDAPADMADWLVYFAREL